MDMDVRWKQRFNNFVCAYQRLGEADSLLKTQELTKLEQQGAIHIFKHTHELAWNVLKDYLEELGVIGLVGSKGTTSEPFKRGLIEDGDTWVRMVEARNLIPHAYNQEIADIITANILDKFYPAFSSFAKKFTGLYG
jgi:nucleotidyltransferase substrate binding protein (TIGR01987 family)